MKSKDDTLTTHQEKLLQISATLTNEYWEQNTGEKIMQTSILLEFIYIALDAMTEQLNFDVQNKMIVSPHGKLYYFYL